MPAGDSSILAKKISLTPPRAGASPALSEFGDTVAKAIGEACGALLQHPIEAKVSAGGMASLRDDLADRTDPGIFYWVMDDAGVESMLVSVTPAFSSVTTECLLGGELQEPPSETIPTNLEFQMSESLVTVISAGLNALFQKRPELQSHIRFSGRRGARTPKEALGEMTAGAAFKISLDLQLGETIAERAITLYILTGFIERIGLLRQQKAQNSSANKTSLWARQLRQQILDSEIALTAELDRFSTNIGELSRLQIGQVIDLHPAALRALELTIMTDAGPANLAKGRLGSYQNNKAVKLTTEIDQEFIRGL